MLRKIRITTAILSMLLITFLFLDFTGIAHQWFGWMAKIQFFPTLLAVNVGVIAGLILLTLLFGRIYCSIICPLGIFQDIIAWISKRRKKKKYSYSPEKKWLRYTMLLLFILAFFTGIASLVALIEPYSAYGRIASNLFAPIYREGNNLLAWIAERADSYAFYTTDVWIKSTATFSVALVTLLTIGYLAWRNGRTWYNTICPVGTVLGYLAKYSLFKPVFNTATCNKCGLCARNCKAACIDAQHQTIDHTRCVTCMNCIEKCNKQAIPETSIPASVPSGNTRRRFLSATTLLAVTAVAKAQQVQLHVDGGLADIADKKSRERATRIVPPPEHPAQRTSKNTAQVASYAYPPVPTRYYAPLPT